LTVIANLAIEFTVDPHISIYFFELAPTELQVIVAVNDDSADINNQQLIFIN
jgi:hypothetical protein